MRSEIDFAGDTDVFRIAPNSGDIDIIVQGIDNSGGSLAAPTLDIRVRDANDFNSFFLNQSSIPNGGGDDDHVFRLFGVANNPVFIEIGGVGDATGSYSVFIDPF